MVVDYDVMEDLATDFTQKTRISYTKSPITGDDCTVETLVAEFSQKASFANLLDPIFDHLGGSMHYLKDSSEK
ncbi:hypothetical protein HDU76_006233, partial [Blyttiomyces sp. JEL0837]